MAGKLIDADRAKDLAEICLGDIFLQTCVKTFLDKCPTVDAVPVDQIRVDINRIFLENQECILDVTICGNRNEVRIPFCRDVVEVVHGEWSMIEDDYMGLTALECSECKQEYWFEEEPPIKIYSHCPNCGAKMDGGLNNA